MRTKTIIAAMLSVVSDIVSPKLSGMQKLQLKRLLLKVLLGSGYLRPFGHFLHTLLDRLFKGKKDSKTVAKKVVLEQLTTSTWNNFVFMMEKWLELSVIKIKVFSIISGLGTKQT